MDSARANHASRGDSRKLHGRALFGNAVSQDDLSSGAPPRPSPRNPERTGTTPSRRPDHASRRSRGTKHGELCHARVISEPERATNPVRILDRLPDHAASGVQGLDLMRWTRGCFVLLWACGQVDAGGGDGGPTDGGMCVAEDEVFEASSLASVTLRIVGEGWILTEGQAGCRPLDVLGPGDRALVFEHDESAVCDIEERHGPPPPSVPLELERLGETPLEIVWDARSLVFFDACFDCPPSPGTRFGVVPSRRGVMQPVAAGRYQLSIPMYEELPAECVADGGGTARCGTISGWGDLPSCAFATRDLAVEVDVPASGQVVIDVDTRL